MKNAANLKKALNALMNVKVSAVVAADLKTREIMRTDDRMQVLQMPILNFMSFVDKVKPVHVQRNDAYRLKNGLANHLDTLLLPQGMFAVVFFEGVFYLVDGNTRKRAWLTKRHLTLPSHVFVTVLIPESKEEAKQFYSCYDSKHAKKSERDEMLSLLCDAGVQTEALLSKLVSGGKFVTVVQAMARRYFVRNNMTNRASVVKAYAGELAQLDQLGLDEKHIPMGAVWAALRLYKELPEHAEFVNDYIGELRKFGTPSAGLIPKAIQHLDERARQACQEEQTGTTGGKACAAMFPQYLIGFSAYIQALTQSKVYSKSYTTALLKKVKKVIAEELQ